MSTTAADVATGDFLVDLDNGYVVDVLNMHYGIVEITFHDRNGEECLLRVPEDHPLTLRTD